MRANSIGLETFRKGGDAVQPTAHRAIFILSIDFSKYVTLLWLLCLGQKPKSPSIRSIIISKMFDERIEVILLPTEKSSFRRQSGRLEADKNLSDTSADAVEKHRLQLQPEKMPESHGTGNRFRTTHHGPYLPQRRAASYAEQVLQQQSYTYTDHEFAAIV